MLSRLLQFVLTHTPVGLFPVRVRTGPAKGARWTLGPFSANWRHGGAEEDVEAGSRYLGDLAGKVFWDFGAHFGIHTVGKALQVGPTGQVASFEPDPVAFSRLKRHVQMNKLANVVLFQAAASSKNSESKFFLLDGGGTSSSHFAFHDGHEPSHEPFLMVRTLQADSLLASGSIRAPDLIKVDVQGHGHEALAGAAKAIAAHLPVVVFSNHSWEELAGVQRIMEPLGYEPKDFNGGAVPWPDVTECILVTAQKPVRPQ